ncbi:C-type lectin domain family 2 member B isoform X1 [Artibeus jamaicensis]|uniref:C-type lectin domain family 2 member B isoform X2 n=1 Tax=Artibeus jamaicensis TaxID=9417 RepID=UPI00235B0FDB|nr:C-type lectin domain family 2 member B isoform X2 [Artibeus jamaicensis]XP_053517394.1 C-type lectin domain family 2 member B isoform X1 [Artibeus jamaicensis]
MTQSIALDAPRVPENAINSQDTGAKEQEIEKEREKHQPEENSSQLPPTGTTARDRTCNLSCDKFKALSGLVVVLLSIIIGLVTTLIVPHKSSQYCCPDEWIGFQDYCYYFSNHERNWTSSRNYCNAKHADLTVINNTTGTMDFLRQHKCTSDHWIGLKMEGKQMGKWVNGAIFNQLFEVSGNETCAYLSDDGVATARCYTERKFICRKERNSK